MRIILTLCSVLLFTGCKSTPVTYQKTPQGAIQAERNGDHKKAIEILESFAKNKDQKAMLHLGLKYHNGKGIPVDYTKAMDWYLEALKYGNADAMNNIGVLYRDGLGVKQNRKIAYSLFLTIHMAMLGNQNTQIRSNKNLRRELAEQPESDRHNALCFTVKYVLKYIELKGKLTVISDDLLPSTKSPRLKDANWWTKQDKANLNFSCPAPWS